jgi:hypothetical protein
MLSRIVRLPWAGSLAYQSLLLTIVSALLVACGTGGSDSPKLSIVDVAEVVTIDIEVADEECVPFCDGVLCGDDGCEGSCGECGEGLTCVAGGCAVLACSEGEDCDDGDACSWDDVCLEGVCAGTLYSCDDELDCTADTCDGDGECEHDIKNGWCLINGECSGEGDSHPSNSCQECMTAVSNSEWANDDTNECDDSNACVHGEYCLDGECESGEETEDCNDGNGCTADSCAPDSGCTYENLESSCDDGDACTDGDSCSGGGCSGDSVDCNDGSPCTVDSCESASGCTYTDAPGDCDDGNECTAGDSCSEGVCEGGASLDCDDGNPCTGDGCNSEIGCTHEAVSGSCSDGNSCTVGDSCSGGECQGGNGALDCNDGNPCTGDSCDAVTGCAHTNLVSPCDDGNICTVGDHCFEGNCESGIALDCADEDACTDDLCHPGSGCQHIQNAGPCDDGNECTESDLCAAGVCGGVVKSCDDGNGCTTDSCNPFTPGGCVYTPNDLVCDDGDPCSLGDTCSGGQCQAGFGSLDCNDGEVCTTDTCEAFTGCKHAPKAGFCDDGNGCTNGDFCANGICIAGGNVCTCQSNSDCAQEEDGDLCNGTLICDKSVVPYGCKVNPATVVTCDPSQNTSCTEQKCQPNTGQCVASPANENGACSDGSNCTQGDFCGNGNCIPGENICTCQNNADCAGEEDGNLCNGTLICNKSIVPYECVVNLATVVTCDPSQNTPCLQKKCQPNSGACVFTPVNENGNCSDGSGCTLNDLCVSGSCKGTPCSAYDLSCVNGECSEDACVSLDFVGATDYVAIQHSSALSFTNTFSIAMWFKSPNVNGHKLLARKGNLHSSYYIWVAPSLHLEYGVYRGSSAFTVVSSKTLQPDTWYHIIMTYDGGSVRGYLNGEFDGIKATSGGGVNTNSDEVMVGYGYPNMWPNAFFPGKVAGMAMWNETLEPGQASTVYTQGVSPEASLVGWWPMTEGSGVAALDWSGHDNDGAVLGASWSEDGPTCGD